MAIRKREWTTGKGERKVAWVVDYKDQHGKRRLKTFQRKKDAEAWWGGQAGYEVAQGILHRLRRVRLGTFALAHQFQQQIALETMSALQHGKPYDPV